MISLQSGEQGHRIGSQVRGSFQHAGCQPVQALQVALALAQRYSITNGSTGENAWEVMRRGVVPALTGMTASGGQVW